MLRKIFAVAALSLGVLSAGETAFGANPSFGFLRRDGPYDRRGFRGRDDHEHRHGRWQERLFCERDDAFRFAASRRRMGIETFVRRAGIDWVVRFR